MNLFTREFTISSCLNCPSNLGDGYGNLECTLLKVDLPLKENMDKDYPECFDIPNNCPYLKV